MEKLRYHFIGIGGISMSAIAKILISEGHYVQGSDLYLNNQCKSLKKLGVKIFKGHKAKNVINADIVVYNSAIKENPELDKAKQLSIKIMSRAELLSEITQGYKNVISVSGAHGKTTTTAMLFYCFQAAQYNPTLHIGGLIKGYDLGCVIGDKNYFITEACEYKDSFLTLKSNYGIVLNVEKEHMDYFKTFSNLKKSFMSFASKCENVVVNSNNTFINGSNVTYFGTNGNYLAKNIKPNESFCYSFDCYFNDKFINRFHLSCVGLHNVSNALSVIAVCKKCGMSDYQIQCGFDNFTGVKRRFENLHCKYGNFVHDYAHHPTEIENTLKTFKNINKNKKIAVIFQPHTYSRTKTLINHFISCFKDADYVGICKTYPAREKYIKDGSAKYLSDVLKKNSVNCGYLPNFAAGKTMCVKKLKQNYAVIILGAGDIEFLAYNLSKLC